MQAEDLSKEDEQEKDDSAMSESEKEDDFIVPDGYLSDDEQIDKEELVENKPNLSSQQGNALGTYFFVFKNYEEGKDVNQDEFVNQFKILKINQEIEFPLSICNTDSKGNQKTQKSDPFSSPEITKQLIRTLHGCYQNKPKIITQFQTLNSNISKQAIKRKIQEISSKKKIANEKQHRYIVDEPIFSQYGIQDEYDTLLKTKQEEFEKNKNPQEISEDSSSDDQDNLEGLNVDKTEGLKNQETLKNLVKLVHGSYDSQKNIINEFSVKNLDCSQRQIKLQLKKIAVKEKRNNEQNQRYYVLDETIKNLKMEGELEEILKEKYEQYQNKMTSMKQIIEEPKKKDRSRSSSQHKSPVQVKSKKKKNQPNSDLQCEDNPVLFLSLIHI
eukprot:TRINITY_DN28628_c0_g1_i2.p1 TRINITY_DN28628_c0_g1~~TRINITY_DN28628_c0_g1_i2.p1  ORF type:complete len:385 (-),score=100.69 TRINITY_DN28628_c0_g1_i2:153-1307(-)